MRNFARIRRGLATDSGAEKATVSLGIMAALQKRGMKVQPFKIGPDFIDPGLHSKVCGVPSYNLDGWMLSQNYNRQAFRKNLRDKDVAVVEGMMGPMTAGAARRKRAARRRWQSSSGCP